MDTATTDAASLARPAAEPLLDEAQLAAAAFLARNQRRNIETYRADLRTFFQWAADGGLDVLAATRPQIELFAPVGNGD